MAGAGGPVGGGTDGARGGLAVDTAELARVRARLEQVAADLAAAGARMAGAAGTALGARALLTGLERAQQDWGTHVRALHELADVAARDLGAAASGYDACEAGAVGRVVAAGLAAPGTAVVPSSRLTTAPLGPLPLGPLPLVPSSLRPLAPVLGPPGAPTGLP